MSDAANDGLKVLSDVGFSSYLGSGVKKPDQSIPLDKDKYVRPIVRFERKQQLRKVLAESGYIILDTIDEVREAINSAGNQIGSVHFIKRTNGSLRKMSFRLHVTNPSVAKKPSGRDVNRSFVNEANNQMTVFDVNKTVRGKDGGVIGRGAWRTVPLDNVTRIVAGGKKYIVI